MSTKMYNYRIPKDQFWTVLPAIRAFYRAHHPMIEVLQQIAGHEPMRSYRRVRELVNSLMEKDWTVDLQVFDEGDTLLLRPLEHGYFFMNHADQDQFAVERVYYDNRTDVPPEDEKNKAVAEWVDAQITAHNYLVVNLLNREDFLAVGIDAMLAVSR